MEAQIAKVIINKNNKGTDNIRYQDILQSCSNQNSMVLA
jgi:hypothetical protein